MLDNKYKELEEQLASVEEDVKSNASILEVQKKKDFQELMKYRDEIKTKKRHHKVSFGGYGYKIKMFFWRILWWLYN